jgi:hypothetical protein
MLSSVVTVLKSSLEFEQEAQHVTPVPTSCMAPCSPKVTFQPSFYPSKLTCTSSSRGAIVEKKNDTKIQGFLPQGLPSLADYQA